MHTGSVYIPMEICLMYFQLVSVLKQHHDQNGNETKADGYRSDLKKKKSLRCNKL